MGNAIKWTTDRALEALSIWFRSLTYLPEYFRGVSRQWVKILFGESVVGAFGTIIAQFAPDWTVWLIFVFGVFLAGYFLWYDIYSTRIPRFHVSDFFVKDRHISHVWHTYDGTKCDTTVAPGKFVQLAPACLGDSAVENCRAYLIRVLRQSDSGWIDTGVNDPAALPWASQDPAMFAVRLEPHAEPLVNVCNTDHENNGVLNVPALSVPINAKLTYPGTFIFDIKFSADNCAPIYCSLEVIVTTWDQISCALRQLTKDDLKARLN